MSAPYDRRDNAVPNESPKTLLTSSTKVDYVDEKGQIRPALLDADAQAAAKDLKDIATTQIRRFFSQVSAIRRRIEIDTRGIVTDAEVLAQVAFLKASAAYAAGRNNANSPILKFLVTHCNSIKDREDFIKFHRHFEAVVAFHRVHGANS